MHDTVNQQSPTQMPKSAKENYLKLAKQTAKHKLEDTIQ